MLWDRSVGDEGREEDAAGIEHENTLSPLCDRCRDSFLVSWLQRIDDARPGSGWTMRHASSRINGADADS